jgi:hypothetical protein
MYGKEEGNEIGRMETEQTNAVREHLVMHL